MVRRLSLATLVATLLLLVATLGPAAAGRGKAQVWINEHNPYTLGEHVTFGYDNVRTNTPWIVLTCSQNGDTVFFHAGGVWSGALGDGRFPLGPSRSWGSGDADCVAEIGEFTNGGKFKSLAEFEFHVYG